MTTAVAADQTLSKDLSTALAFECDEVVSRYQREKQVPLSEARALFVETKRWLWACAQRARDERAGKPVPKQLLISPELTAIDQMWHCFLLFTREYQRFCKECLGEFIHHTPLTSQELTAFEELRARNPKDALERRRAELKPQLEYLYDLLGPGVLSAWYRKS